MVAQQHYNRALLRRGLALWKRLVQLQQDAAQVSYLIGSVGASAGSRKLRSEPLLKICRAQKKKKALKLLDNSKGESWHMLQILQQKAAVVIEVAATRDRERGREDIRNVVYLV